MRPYQARSWRGRPLRWLAMSRGVRWFVATSSYSLRPGNRSISGSSQANLPSPARMARVVVVNALLEEPIAKSVSSVTGLPSATSRIP